MPKNIPDSCPNCHQPTLEETPLGIRFCRACMWIERKGEPLAGPVEQNPQRPKKRPKPPRRRRQF